MSRKKRNSFLIFFCLVKFLFHRLTVPRGKILFPLEQFDRYDNEILEQISASRMMEQLEERDSIFETSFPMQRIQRQLGCIVANHLKTRPVNINLLICLFVPLTSLHPLVADIQKSVMGSSKKILILEFDLLQS